MIRAAALLLVLSAAPAAAQDWCRYSGLNVTERTICADPALQWRDLVLNRLWEQNGGGDGLPVSQNEWIAARNACGSNVSCIADTYDTRILRLRDILTAEDAPAGRPWCDARSLSSTEATICATPFLADLDAALNRLDGALDANAPRRDGWVTERDTCGTSLDCIERAYLERFAEYGRLVREADGS